MGGVCFFSAFDPVEKRYDGYTAVFVCSCPAAAGAYPSAPSSGGQWLLQDSQLPKRDHCAMVRILAQQLAKRSWGDRTSQNTYLALQSNIMSYSLLLNRWIWCCECHEFTNFLSPTALTRTRPLSKCSGITRMCGTLGKRASRCGLRNKRLPVSRTTSLSARLLFRTWRHMCKRLRRWCSPRTRRSKRHGFNLSSMPWFQMWVFTGQLDYTLTYWIHWVPCTELCKHTVVSASLQWSVDIITVHISYLVPKCT